MTLRGHSKQNHWDGSADSEETVQTICSNSWKQENNCQLQYWRITCKERKADWPIQEVNVTQCLEAFASIKQSRGGLRLASALVTRDDRNRDFILTRNTHIKIALCFMINQGFKLNSRAPYSKHIVYGFSNHPGRTYSEFISLNLLICSHHSNFILMMWYIIANSYRLAKKISIHF